MWTTIISILLMFIPNRFSSFLFARKQQEKHVNQQRHEEVLAEIDGGLLPNRTSVFLHLEQGLARSLHKPAIISTHQPADHLKNLLALCGEEQEQQNKTVRDANSASGDIAITNDGYIRSDCLKLSYRQVHGIAQELAAGILASGAQSRSTILMLIPNGAEFGLLLWTSIIMELTITCADPDVLRADGPDELRHILRSLKPSLIVVAEAETAFEVDGLVDKLRLAKPLRICLTRSVARSGWKALVDIMAEGVTSTVDRDELIERARNDDPQRVHSILFTSGSSGSPKGCPMRVGGQTHYMHSQAWLIDRQACPLVLQQAHPSRGIAHLQTLLTWKAGGAVVMTGRGFVVEDAAEALRQLPITFLALSPPMVHEIREIVTRTSLDAGSIQTVQVGGDAVTKGILMKCAAAFPYARVVVAHGMTEGGGSFHWPFWGTPLPKIPYFGELCPVGAVSPGSVVRIWNADQVRVCKRGESGALHVNSGSLIHHYMFGASESSFYNDNLGRWFNTGDIAVMDSQGIVSILGRSKDIIKRAGVTIMPAPLENCIETFTGEQTVIVSIPHKTRGHQPFAVLRSFAGRRPDDINEYVRKTLGKHYSLDGLLALKDLGLNEFPINATHKIVKAEVQNAVLQYLDSSRTMININDYI